MKTEDHLQKAQDSASFLLSDLQNANKDADRVLSILLLELIEEAVKIENKLKQINA